MGLDITVMIADWRWLAEVPPPERLSRLRDAWYDDETGLWDHDAPAVEGDWVWPRGPHGAHFAVYEFLHTCGSFKAHFWAGQRWEAVRDHVERTLRTELDGFLHGLIRDGPDGEVRRCEPGLLGDGPAAYGVLLARSPAGVRELAAAWERIRSGLAELRGPFTEHAAVADGWAGDFDAFGRLLTEWGRIVAEAARRGWGLVGLSE
ncbi:hypothetical protein ACFV83_06960 [Streptomyces pharetrae]|jgi:hypothetical protein